MEINFTFSFSFLSFFQGVEIFSMHKAKGMHLLSVINKNPGIETDVYWAHTVLSNDGKHIALVSLQCVYIYKSQFSSNWREEQAF